MFDFPKVKDTDVMPPGNKVLNSQSLWALVSAAIGINIYNYNTCQIRYDYCSKNSTSPK